MKYFFFISSLFTYLFSNAQIQKNSYVYQNDMQITYKLTYTLDSTSENRKSELMMLKIGGNLSHFESIGSLALDSLLNYAETLPFDQNNADLIKQKLLNIPKSDFYFSIYKNIVLGNIRYFDLIGKNHYMYNESLPLFEWRKTNLTATIAGYSCQQALTTWRGRTFEAWYTREIPVADGPYKFCGLPGLIVKVSDSKKTYVFELLKLVKIVGSTAVAYPTNKYKNTSRAEFVKGKTNFEVNPLDKAAEMNIDIQNPEIAKQKMKLRAKKFNNPIELH